MNCAMKMVDENHQANSEESIVSAQNAIGYSYVFGNFAGMGSIGHYNVMPLHIQKNISWAL